jgi:hypothetical protein
MMPLEDFKQLHRMVDAIFREARGLGWSWETLAGEAGVGVTTVYRLGRAVGLTLKFEPARARVAA